MAPDAQSILTATEPPHFFQQVFPEGTLRTHELSGGKHRPHVTLTYAQSLDGFIAGEGGKQLILSGKESMVMTHWLRTMHDAILVGRNTVRNDNPQLNTRYLPPREKPYPQPRPIIIDTNLRTDPSCKLLVNYQNGLKHRSPGTMPPPQPWIICATWRLWEAGSESPTEERRSARESALEAAGARVIRVSGVPRGIEGGSRSFIDVDLNVTLAVLAELGIRSVMVEGGARIISSFMGLRDEQSEGDHRGESVVDTHIVTVAPILVGDGIPATNNLKTIPTLVPVANVSLGKDMVFASTFASVAKGDKTP